MRRAALALGLLLAGCATTPAPRSPSAEPSTSRISPAPSARSVIGAPDALPGWAGLNHAAAREAFKRGCAKLAGRTDPSGLTTAADWAAPCADAEAGDAAFFSRHFTAVRIGDGRGLATGYYEPELAGCRTPSPGCDHPLYRRPPDLIDVSLQAFDPALPARTLRGRLDGARLVPYADRAAIEGGALAGRGLELAYAADPIDAFFLEIQGSGRIRLPDGQVMRVGYAAQNGQPYVAIGRLLRAENQIPPGSGMAEIKAWLRADAGRGRAMMRRNPSAVFFRELTGPDLGPIGALNVPLLAGATAATDPTITPLGAPVVLTLALPAAAPAPRLLVAQDTGGAIRGPNRFDLFFGPGHEAEALAGALASPVEAVILLPNAAARRLADAAPPRP